ncbi:PilW family protein [Ralstonia pseudosolanacearum]|uniref:PilW family protein n=1 Tax=Ralstonia pseudosolanacearum TaxID=1310165 RepID=UPI001FF7540C|nr:PilW family protein [Ralstonia pseudosolanacearum]
MSAASHRKQWRPAVRQSGTSLIELMIAMVISLVILSGVVVVFINMKQSFTNQDQLALLEDNERLTLSILTGTAQSAGYFPDPVNNSLTSLLVADSTAAYGPLVAGQAVNGTTGTGTGSASDKLTLRYATASGDGILNCLGGTNTSGSIQVYVNTFSISSANELQCSLNGATAVPLVSGVSGFSVTYGVDTNGNGYVDTYMSATQVQSGGYWALVRSIQVTLTFTTSLSASGAQTQTTTQWVQNISLLGRVT